MANYSVKLVNHTGTTDRLRQSIKFHLQQLFDKVFAGTSDKAIVDWGSGMASDQIVLHFVNDIANSYLQQHMPGNQIRADAGGHTRLQGHTTGSEFYFHVVMGGRRTAVTDLGYAKIAFHESMHNQFPGWSNLDMHGPAGGGGLAASPPQGDEPNDKNKDLMRRGMAIKNDQLL